MLRTATLAVTFLAGIIVILAFFFDVGFLATAEARVQDWGVIVAAFALAMASINLVQVNIRRISSSDDATRRSAPSSCFAALVVMSIIGFTQGPKRHVQCVV